MSLFEVINEGGFVMYPLLLCSILVWAIALEKVWFLNQFTKQFELLFSKAEVLLEEKKINEAKGLSHGAHAFIARPYLSLFDGDKFDKESWEQKIERNLLETRQGLKKFLWILGTIGSSAPFIGLFGTVVGIIKSFDSMAKAGKSGFAVVATGLSEALIATAAGIIVAVMAVIMYNYFQNRLAGVNLNFKHRLEDLLDFVDKRD